MNFRSDISELLHHENTSKYNNHIFNVFHVRALYYTKTLITNKMHKENFIINRNTLLHVSTLLGHLQGELPLPLH
jgi:hypothetical protein